MALTVAVSRPWHDQHLPPLYRPSTITIIPAVTNHHYTGRLQPPFNGRHQPPLYRPSPATIIPAVTSHHYTGRQQPPLYRPSPATIIPAVTSHHYTGRQQPPLYRPSPANIIPAVTSQHYTGPHQPHHYRLFVFVCFLSFALKYKILNLNTIARIIQTTATWHGCTWSTRLTKNPSNTDFIHFLLHLQPLLPTPPFSNDTLNNTTNG